MSLSLKPRVVCEISMQNNLRAQHRMGGLYLYGFLTRGSLTICSEAVQSYVGAQACRVWACRVGGLSTCAEQILVPWFQVAPAHKAPYSRHKKCGGRVRYISQGPRLCGQACTKCFLTHASNVFMLAGNAPFCKGNVIKTVRPRKKLRRKSWPTNPAGTVTLVRWARVSLVSLVSMAIPDQSVAIHCHQW